MDFCACGRVVVAIYAFLSSFCNLQNINRNFLFGLRTLNLFIDFF